MNKPKRYLLSLLVILGCTTTKPSMYYNKKNFELLPKVVQENGYWHLKYKLQLNPTAPVIESKIVNNELHFYTSFFISSHAGTLKTIKEEINDPKRIEYIKNNQVFWVNPDGSKIKL